MSTEDLTLRPDPVRSREITLTVPVGLRYQTTKLLTDGDYTELSCERGPIDPTKAMSQSLGRTMPDTAVEGWESWDRDGDPEATVDGYTLSFSKMV